MLQTLTQFFASAGYVPHGYCLLWRWDLLALHSVSDFVIAFSYLTIPIAILRLLRGRSDIAYRNIPILFSAFIGACAVTHLFGLLTIWYPVYALEGIFKAVCAVISAITAVLLWKILPVLIAMPGPSEHSAKAAELEAEVQRRRQAEAALSVALAEVHKINAELEQRVEARTADLRSANEELERFAYIASHDLRAPLRALMTVPGWLRETLVERYGVVERDLEEDLHEMEVQSARMDRLLTDLLTYARIGQSGEFWEIIDPEAKIRESAQLSGMPEGFEVAIEGELPPVRCIPTEFALVMRNLISNAIKHHDRQQGRIIVTGNNGGDLSVLEIRDDGPGIAQKYAEKVFEMFSTLRPRDEVEGSGMGLAMVKKIMERTGGWVRLGDAGGERGAVFQLAFPVGGPDKGL